MVIKQQETVSSMPKAIIAFAIWIGPIYLNVALVTAVFFLLPAPSGFMVLGLLAFFALIPLNDKSKLGAKLARYICREICRYFPVILYVEDIDLFDPNQAYVLALEPHSVFPMGVFALLDHIGFMPLPKIKFLASSIIFYAPFLRHIWTWLGLTPATRQNFLSLLKSGFSCIIVPGGMREVFHMESTSEVAFLKERKGFVRIAMETGCPLVPVFCFNQTNVYKWLKPSWKWYESISRAIRCTPIIFWGVLGSPLPYRNTVHVVVGKPILLERNPQPTMEEVSDAHNQFLEALEELFQKHKHRVGNAHVKLKII